MSVDSRYLIERYKAHTGLEYPFTTESIGLAAMVVGTVDSLGVCAPLLRGTDYTIEFGYRDPIFSRGKVILKVPLSTGYQLAVSRLTPREQDTVLFDTTGFPSEEYENAVDKITFMLQELEGELCFCPDDTCVALVIAHDIYNTRQTDPIRIPQVGDTLFLNNGVTGTGPYTYLWYVDGVADTGPYAALPEFQHVVAGDVSITVEVSNACTAPILSDPYLVTVTV